VESEGAEGAIHLSRGQRPRSNDPSREKAESPAHVTQALPKLRQNGAFYRVFQADFAHEADSRSTGGKHFGVRRTHEMNNTAIAALFTDNLEDSPGGRLQARCYNSIRIAELLAAAKILNSPTGCSSV